MVMRQRRCRPHGYTYLVLLWWVTLSSIMLAALATQWSIESRRQKEQDLVWKARQITSAIQSYAKVPVSEGIDRYPRRLEDLLLDTRTGTAVRHLRQLWPDPLVQGAWGLIRDTEAGGIRGVYSRSSLKPLANPVATTYEEWRFDVEPVKAAPPR